MTLDELRSTVDRIDDDILDLLEQRAAIAADIARVKQASGLPAYDSARERDVLSRLEAKASGHLPPVSIRAVYREVMSACLALQEPIHVSFLGPAGTFTHAAARELFGLSARYVEAATIDGIFDSIRRKSVTFGVVPIENSTEGSVDSAIDALLEGDVVIRREMVLPVTQCLMSTASGLTEIERVYSHPQALAQCRNWLAKNLDGAQLIRTTSTAAAARDALADAGAAAIGSGLAAEFHGVPVLRDAIQDLADNATRFVVLASHDAEATGRDKTTVAFAVHDARGALLRVLEVFDSNDINLSRIESRPSRQKAWDYVFLADLEGHRTDANVREALLALSSRCPLLRVLGSYPRAESRSNPPPAT